MELNGNRKLWINGQQLDQPRNIGQKIAKKRKNSMFKREEVNNVDNSRIHFNSASEDIIISKIGLNFFLRQKIDPNGQTG